MTQRGFDLALVGKPQAAGILAPDDERRWRVIEGDVDMIVIDALRTA